MTKRIARIFRKSRQPILLFAEEFISAITELSKRLGIPQSLTEIGIPYEAIPILAEKALADVCTPGNPIRVDINDIKNIYREAFH